MENYRVFFDEGDFWCWTEAEEVAENAWSASVLVERAADHKARKELIKGVRHTIRGKTFPTKQDAVQAAYALVHALIETDDVGL